MASIAVPWDSDRVREQSSQDVVVAWLADERNYERWKSVGRGGTVTKESLCVEVNRQLHLQGIRHRNTRGIFKKITSLESSMLQAHRRMATEGFAGLTTLEGCEESVQNEILKRWPYFELLAPVIRPPERKKHKTKPLISRRLQEEQAEDSEPVYFAARSSDEEDHNGSELADPESREAEEDTEDQPNTTSDQNSVQDAATAESQEDGDTDTMTPFEKLDLEQKRLCYALKRERTQLELEATRKKRKIELQTTREKSVLELEKCKGELEVTRERNECELVVERALSRQKLLSAGVSPGEVDRLLPSRQWSI